MLSSSLLQIVDKAYQVACMAEARIRRIQAHQAKLAFDPQEELITRPVTHYRPSWASNGWTREMAPFESTPLWQAETSSIEAVRARRRKEDIAELEKWADLDNNSLIRTVHRFQKRFGTIKDHMETLFGVYIPDSMRTAETEKDKWFERYCKQLGDWSREAHCASVKYRIETELKIAEAQRKLVLFSTLTVSQEDYEEVFKVKSRAWDTYTKAFKRNCKNWRAIAVTERGTLRGRLHIHVLHIFDETRWKWVTDPNPDSQGTEREIVGFRSLWKYGKSSNIAVRSGTRDGWAERLGFRWPCIDEDGVLTPIEPGPPRRIANYMAKYIVKAFKLRKDYKWRTKITNNFGTQMITAALLTMKRNSKIHLLRGLAFLTQNLENPIPKTLIMREAMKQIWQQNRNPLGLRRAIRPLETLRTRFENSNGTIRPIQQERYALGRLTTMKKVISEFRLAYEGAEDWLAFRTAGEHGMITG